MPTTLPIPVSFRLPDPAWQPVQPESLGVTNAAFLAVRREHVGEGYAPTITISGDEAPGRSLEELADESVEVLRQQTGDAELVKRRDYGTEQAPGLLQQVDTRLPEAAGGFDVRQLQALVQLRDVDDPERTAVVKAVLSTTYAQHDTYLPEFQQFLATLRVRPSSSEE